MIDFIRPGATRSVNLSHVDSQTDIEAVPPVFDRTGDWNTKCAVKGTRGDSNRNRRVSENAMEVVTS